MKRIIPILVVLFLNCTLIFGQAEVSSRLQQEINKSNPNDYIKTLIYLSDQVDLETLDAQLYLEKASPQIRAYKVIIALQEKAASTQGALINFLEEKLTEREVFSYKTFWIANLIMVEAKADIINQIKNRADVSQMDIDAMLDWDKPTQRGNITTEEILSTEPGLKIVNADKLWALGITGSGRLLMGIDTGVRHTHVALNSRFRGNFVPMSQAWFDPSGSTTPSDCDGHGTHTMGTMVGRSTAGDTVGLAIDAQWIASNTLCTGGTSANISAFQWALNPDGNPSTTSDMPDAIGNSWYDPDITNECTGIYKTTFDALETAGIAVVFSAGNAGSGTSTITKPKNINTDETNVFCVANIQGSLWLAGNNDPIASSSSRGPSTCGGTGSLLIKPEVSAPGTSVRSSYSTNDNSYSSLSGTSMACPHVVGAIGLLKQAFPTLTGKQIKLALYNTARDLGAAGEDNTYGKGLIDVYAAFLSLGVPDTIAPTKINNLSVVDPTSNSFKLQWTAPLDTSTGGVTQYDIRMSSNPIIDSITFYAATKLTYNLAPKPAGSSESFVVNNLGFSTTRHFAIRSRDAWGNWSLISNPASGTTWGAPTIDADPDSLHQVMINNTTVIDTVALSNISSGNSTLDYQIAFTNNTFPTGSVILSLLPKQDLVNESNKDDKNNPAITYGQSIEGQGGPDAFGYKWIDSDAPNGPAYVWNDITSTGTLVTAWTPTSTFDPKDEGIAGPFSLGFNFKFYGNNKSNIYISSNGLILFNTISSDIFTNASIPTPSIPNEYIAPFWDDLDGTSQGTVHYKQEPNKFIVQFTNWQKYSATGSLTFQIVLHSNGKINFYYNNMNATLNSATVGIENSAGAVGLQVAYNAAYVKNNLAVQFAAEPDWLSANTASGTLYNGNLVNVLITFRSEDYPVGEYSMNMVVTSNDPAKPTLTVPIRMTITIPVQLNLTAMIEGLSNGTTTIADTVSVELRKAISPFALIEGKKIALDDLGAGAANFSSVLEGTPYYIVVKHRNGLETWSANPLTFSAGSLAYDFTNAQNKAFGNNLKIKGTKWCFFSGDLNYDGIIDLSDIAIIDLDNLSFATGYRASDLTGDNIVDLSDVSLADNNNLNFVAKVTPTSTAKP